MPAPYFLLFTSYALPKLFYAHSPLALLAIDPGFYLGSR